MPSYDSQQQNDLKSDIFREQIAMLFSQTPLVSLSNIPAAIITVYIFKDTVPLNLLLLWSTLISIYAIVRIYPTLVFKRLKQHNIEKWKRISVASVFFMGCLWGALTLLFSYELTLFQQNYIILVLLGLSSIAIAASRAYLPTFFAFIFPALLPLSWHFLTSGVIEHTGLGILILFYIVILIGSAKSAVANTIKTIQLRIENSYLVQELSLSNHDLSIEIEERKYIQQELEASKKSAVQASQEKSEFISRMSHELRTPMNAILGYSDLLLEDSVLNEQQISDLNRIKNAGEHLLDLINEVLDISRIEAGNIDLTMEKIDLEKLVNECIQLVEDQAKKSNIAIHIQLKQDVELFVHADKQRLKQILLNLISNAIKYNKQNGDVWLEWKLNEKDKIHIKIRDNGIGIAEDKQKELFQPFNRLGADSTNVEGTGIGLVITKNLIEAMMGKVGFTSGNEGTTFWFEINQA